MGKFCVVLGDETHAKWNAYCKSHGETASDEVRAFIESRIENSTPPMRVTPPRKAQKKIGIKVYYTESELEGIRLRTMLNGGTRNAWIIKVTRAALTRQPVFDTEEADALRKAVAELTAVGKSLNMCARRLNSGYTHHGLDIDLISRVSARSREVSDKVRKVIAVNLERWEIRA